LLFFALACHVCCVALRSQNWGFIKNRLVVPTVLALSRDSLEMSYEQMSYEASLVPYYKAPGLLLPESIAE